MVCIVALQPGGPWLDFLYSLHGLPMSTVYRYSLHCVKAPLLRYKAAKGMDGSSDSIHSLDLTNHYLMWKLRYIFNLYWAH